MSGIGERLREERERLGFSQAVFGELGGVKANAQGNYEKGDRFPDAAYLAAVSLHGVDVLYVVTGVRIFEAARSLSSKEMTMLEAFRALSDLDQDTLTRMVSGLAGR